MSAEQLWAVSEESSQQALRWARAMARLKGSRAGSEELEVADILLGILLTHPGKSPPQVLFEHFGLTARQVLPDKYPAVDADALAEEIRRIPDELPPLDSLAQDVAAAASDFVDPPERVNLSMLFAALIRSSNPTASAIRTKLTDVGVDGSKVADAYVEFVSQGGSEEELGDWLQEQFPEAQRPVRIPDYKADLAAPGLGSEDLLGIQAEVDAFAYLLASRGLTPPLAIGLFGDWGSGKSFFMRSVRRRVEEITAAKRVRDVPQSELPYWKYVVQVEFNAWHYVEGSLWASLVENVFHHLATAHDQDDVSVVARRQRQVFDRLTTLAQQRAIATHQRETLAEDLTNKRQEARAKEQERDDKLVELDAARRQAFEERLAQATRTELMELIPGWTARQGLAPANDLLAELGETRRQLRRGRALLGPFWSSGRHLWVALAALALVPLIPFLLQRIGGSGAVQVTGALAAVFAYVAGLLRIANGWLRGRLERIDAIRQEVDQAFTQAQRDVDEQVKAARQAVDQAEQALQTAVREEQAIADQVDRLNAELATITPTRVLTDFLSERARADDYRRYLGVAALIRQDFEQLSDLIREQNRNAVRGQVQDELGINRIILYIDDLDRCPADKVIKVLQAVHLLLAFDPFVVVVAVDSRWLSNSLVREHPSLVAAAGGDTATPQDYLEKIFQLPFWIQPLAEGSRRLLVHGLLEQNLLREASREPTAAAGAMQLQLDDQHRKVIQEMLRSTGRAHVAAETLAITRQELEFLDQLAPLMGDTPRTVKRLVNVYQLLTAMPRVRHDNHQDPTETLVVAFLVAINESLPNLAPKLFRIARQFPTIPLEDLLEKIDASEATAEKQRVEDWLRQEQRDAWQRLPASRLLPHLPLVERVGFREARTFIGVANPPVSGTVQPTERRG